MADSGSDNERELPATTRQRERFAEKGDTPRSRELISAMTLGATSLLAISQAPDTARSLTHVLAGSLRHVGQPPDGALLRTCAAAYLQVVLPLGGAAILAALVGSALQRQGKLQWQMPQLDLTRLNPIAGLGRLLSIKTVLTNMLSTIVKVSTLGFAMYLTWRAQVPKLVQQTPASLGRGFADSGHMLFVIFERGLWTLFILGLLDYGIAWWRLERKMRMSMQDVRDEAKESSGDPSVRSRRRKKHRELVRARSLKDVPKADVILVNPTHVAVAVQYAAGLMPAPRVVAKGEEAQAERIRQIARKHQVPIVSQPPLARLLYAQVKVGAFVPAEMYKAVAVVLAHVYRLRKRG